MSSATAIRRAPNSVTRRPTRAGSRTAAVPTTTRAAPAVESGLDRAFVAQATGDLTARPIPYRVDDPGDDLRLPASAVARTVQIDDVDPGRAGLHEARGNRDRVRPVDGFAGEVAFRQADDLASAQVDGGQQLELAAVRGPGARLGRGARPGRGGGRVASVVLSSWSCSMLLCYYATRTTAQR